MSRKSALKYLIVGCGCFVFGLIVLIAFGADGFSLVILCAGFALAFVGGLALLIMKRHPDRKDAENAAPLPQIKAAPAPEKAKAATIQGNNYKFRVAGVKYYDSAVRAVARRNPDYYMSASDMKIFDVMEGRKHWEFLPDLSEPRFVFEPENPYDSKAIAVYIGTFMVGHVPSVENAAVRRIIAKPYTARAWLSGGRWKALQEDGTLAKGEYTLNINIELDY